VARKAAGDDVDGIDPNVLAIPGMARREDRGGGDDATQAVIVKRESGSFLGRALLDLHERDGASAPGDQVDLSAPHFRARRKDSPSVQAQPPGGNGLGPASATFSLGAVQDSPSSSRARA
jgi:hypothetical protein